jgi:urease accessory protein
VARGERWAFRRFESRNEVFLGNERIFLDSLLLDPAAGALESRFRMGRFNSLALVFVAGDPFQEISARLVEAAAAVPVARAARLLVAASPVRGGAVVRVAGERNGEVAAEVRRLLAFLPEFLHDDPWSRKW